MRCRGGEMSQGLEREKEDGAGFKEDVGMGWCRPLDFGRIRMERICRLKGESLLRMTLVECWRFSRSRSELERQKI
jgi:hypothetical protein